MLNNQQKLAICAAHFASNQTSNDFALIARSVPIEQRTGFVQLLTALDALWLVRRARQIWREGGATTLPVLAMEGDAVKLDGSSIGRLLTWHRTVLPQEMQARIAYESLLDRFLAHIAAKQKIVALSVNDLAVQVFVPSKANRDLGALWQEFVQVAFSRAELEKTFVLLMNSVKLTDRGFGAVEFPSVSHATAEIQAAFYLATLEQRVLFGSADYKAANTRYKELTRRRGEAEKKNQKDKIVGIERELAEVSAQRAAALKVNRVQLENAVEDFSTQIPAETLAQIRKSATHFNSLARNQFSYGTVKARTGNPKAENIANSIEDMIIKLATTTTNFSLPCLLQTETQLPTMRESGDRQGKICYICGRTIAEEHKAKNGKREKGSQPSLTANRFILAAPSQRLQSGTGQEQPVVCRACAAIAMVSPIKLTTDNTVVRLSFGKHDDWGLRDYLRMLTLGELNLAAGRYLLLKCTETVPMQRGGRIVYVPVSEPMGALQYALFRVATTLPRDTLRHCRAWLVTNAEVVLPTRWMVWLNYLQEIFNLRLTYKDEKTNSNKTNQATFAAVRLIQKEEVIKATYALITADANEVRRITAQSYSEMRLLEELRQVHCELLEKEKTMTDKAQMFRHVAALTGLLNAFCDFVDSQCGRGSDTAKREISKLIEEVTDPYQFCYRATHNLSGEMATIFRRQDNYFCFDEADRLLAALPGVDAAERQGASEQGTRTLRVYFDDVRHAYTALFETTYKTEKEQKDFTTELKLSLAAKFPEYFVKKERE